MNTTTAKTLTLDIKQDSDVENPTKDWDKESFKFVSGWSREFSNINCDGNLRDYGFTGDLKSFNKRKLCQGRGWHLFVVYAYVHSGTTISLSPFTCPWDSGIAGVMAIKTNSRDKKKIQKMAESYVNEWDMYLTGDVWGYTIKDEDENVVDSLWGMYGFDYCKKEGEEALKRLQEQENTEQTDFNNSL